MKKIYKANIMIYDEDNKIGNYEKLIVEEVVKGYIYKELITGYKIKAVYLNPITIKAIMHDALLGIGEPEKYISEEISKNGVAIILSLNDLSKDDLSRHLCPVRNRVELVNYMDEFPNTKFFNNYKHLVDSNKVKIKKWWYEKKW